METFKPSTGKEMEEEMVILRLPSTHTLTPARLSIVVNSVKQQPPQEMEMETTLMETETVMVMEMVTLL